MRVVHVNLPRVGLGNRLFPWARGKVFAKRHDLECHVSGWHKASIGPWLRRENTKRLYGGSFRGPGVGGLVRFRLRTVGVPRVREEDLSEGTPLPDRCVVVFDKVTNAPDFFAELRPHRDWLRDEIMSHLADKLRRRLSTLEPPFIGVHVRRGDFKLGVSVDERTAFRVLDREGPRRDR